MAERDTSEQDINGEDINGQDNDGRDTAGQDAPRRFFSRSERFVLQALAGGRCEECGAELGDGFHADHRLPFSAGGRTDLGNAAALCPRCNLNKGTRVQGVLAQNTSEMGTGAPAPTQGAAPPAPLTTPAPPAPPAVASIAPPTPPAVASIAAVPETDGTPPPRGITLPPWGLTLRPWQQEGAHVWGRIRAGGGRDALITATPGSGKTDLALFLAREEFRHGRADLLVVVCPSLVLKTQWSRSAHRAGIPMTGGWSNNAVAPPADVRAVAVTFAQVAALPEALRLLCARRRVFAVMDEIHRCAANLRWGAALHQALEHAQARLALSGTAWRSDGAPIPFVTYDEDGNCASDVTYDYAQALTDGVLRECFFFALGARVSWLGEGGERHATFADPLGERDRARRLRAALDPQGDWLPAMLRRADAALAQARAGHPGAKAMVVAMDVAHARAVAGLLRGITGEAPALALSDDPAALSTLERFRSGSGRWLVVVRMASEGYDCPDIRVVAWATNVVSEGAFRQVVARALRVVPGLIHQDAPVFQEAQVFLPADERLLAMARALVGGRISASVADAGFGQDAGAEEEDEAGEEAQSREAGGRGLFVPLSSRATGQSVVTGGSVLPASALRRARAMNLARPGASGVPDHQLAATLARMEAEAERLEASGPGSSGPGSSGPGSSGPGSSGPGSSGSETAGSVPETAILPGAILPGAILPGGALPAATSVGEWETGVGTFGEGRDPHETQEDNQTQEDDQTYDQQRQALRRLCTRLTALIARELDVNPSLVHRAFHRSLGVRQAEATLAGLEQRKRMLEDKLRELRAA